MRWSGEFPYLSEFPTVCCDPHNSFSTVNRAEQLFFLEFSCFLYDPMDVGNLISGFSAFFKSRRKYICKFLVHVLLKPSLEDFELDFAVM